MKKKYKLLKWYPSLPKEWKVGDIAEYFGGVYLYEVENKEGFVSVSEVKTNPEFWQEVIEKDYEVLLWYDGGNTYQHNLRQVDSTWRIHSVKRLSDDEVFTVGDEIKTCTNGYCFIYGFSIVNDKLSIDHTHSDVLNEKFPGTSFNHHLHLISKVKKPLFTTEDGVDIYEGDEVYWLAVTDETLDNLYSRLMISILLMTICINLQWRAHGPIVLNESHEWPPI